MTKKEFDLKNMGSYKWCTKKICIALLSVMMLALASNCVADDFIALKIYPEHVGVFTSDGQQQFVAFGIRSDGSQLNITTDVDWVSNDETKVKIDKNGLAEIVDSVTSGQVKISCLYPKTGKSAAAVGLLLSN